MEMDPTLLRECLSVFKMFITETFWKQLGYNYGRCSGVIEVIRFGSGSIRNSLRAMLI